ncbi:hypothetical protein Tco_1499315 [Tanacetum coccineum]
MLPSEWVFVGSLDSSGICDNVWCQARTSTYGHDMLPMMCDTCQTSKPTYAAFRVGFRWVFGLIGNLRQRLVSSPDINIRAWHSSHDGFGACHAYLGMSVILELGSATRCLASGCCPVGLWRVCSVTRARRQSLRMLPSEWVFVGSLDSSGICNNVWCQARTSAYGHGMLPMMVLGLVMHTWACRLSLN